MDRERTQEIQLGSQRFWMESQGTQADMMSESDLQSGKLACAVTDVVDRCAKSIEHRHVKVAHRCFFRHANMPTCIQCPTAMTGKEDRKILVIVSVPVTQTASINNHRMIQQTAFSICSIFHLLQQVT